MTESKSSVNRRYPAQNGALLVLTAEIHSAVPRLKLRRYDSYRLPPCPFGGTAADVAPRVVEISAHAPGRKPRGRVGGAGEPNRHLAAMVRMRHVVSPESLLEQRAYMGQSEK